jgi:hypothetical protein
MTCTLKLMHWWPSVIICGYRLSTAPQRMYLVWSSRVVMVNCNLRHINMSVVILGDLVVSMLAIGHIRGATGSDEPWPAEQPPLTVFPDCTRWYWVDMWSAHRIPQLQFQLSKPDRYFFIQVTAQFIRSRGWVWVANSNPANGSGFLKVIKIHVFLQRGNKAVSSMSWDFTTC